jgi:hypothetical protein
MGMWRWLNTPKSWIPRPRCPICGREIVGDIGRVRDWGILNGRLPTWRDAKIARCPVHGHTHFHRPQ